MITGNLSPDICLLLGIYPVTVLWRKGRDDLIQDDEKPDGGDYVPGTVTPSEGSLVAEPLLFIWRVPKMDTRSPAHYTHTHSEKGKTYNVWYMRHKVSLCKRHMPTTQLLLGAESFQIL